MLESAVKYKVMKAWKDKGGLGFNISEKFASGIPDSYFAMNSGGIWIEYKIDYGQLSKLQEKTLSDLSRHGIQACVVRYKNKTKTFNLHTWGDIGRTWTGIDLKKLIDLLFNLCGSGEYLL